MGMQLLHMLLTRIQSRHRLLMPPVTRSLRSMPRFLSACVPIGSPGLGAMIKRSRNPPEWQVQVPRGGCCMKWPTKPGGCDRDQCQYKHPNGKSKQDESTGEGTFNKRNLTPVRKRHTPVLGCLPTAHRAHRRLRHGDSIAPAPPGPSPPPVSQRPRPVSQRPRPVSQRPRPVSPPPLSCAHL
jgi:hypothetical protein